MSAPTTNPATVELATAAQADSIAAQLKRRWRAGEQPDTTAALAEYPDLLHFKSVVVNLAYEEYCLLEQRDAAPDPGHFCERMPAYQGSIRAVIEAHRLLDEHPELLEPGRGAWPRPGDHFDGLQVVGELGRGSFARAYLAFDPETDRPCVLKLSATCGGEGRTLGPLKHPHVTEVYWARRIDGFNAVCMPLLGAATLYDVRRHAFRDRDARPRSSSVLLEAIDTAPATALVSPAPPPVVRPAQGYAAGVVAIGARIAAALAYLHAQKLGHGDLKPSNVLLGPGGHPYLIDFNLAPGADRPGIGGTLPYMAPEQLRVVAGHEAGPADPAKADVYSLGLVLVELLTGRLPLAPADEPDLKAAAAELLARRAAHGVVSWPTDAAVPAPVARLVERCLADAPVARPSAAEVSEALDRWQTAPAATRRRLQWAVAAVVAAALAAGAVWLDRLTGVPDASPVAPPATAPQLPRAPQTAADYFARGKELLREGDLTLAWRDFRTAAELDRNRDTVGYVAYCAARETPLAGADLGKDAIALGAETAPIYNIVGYGYLQSDQPAEALNYLDRAIELDGNLQPARYNRALARYRCDLDKARSRVTDRRCVEDIELALGGPVQAPVMYFQAARLHAAASHLDPASRDKALAYLRQAVRLGQTPRTFPDDPVLKANLGTLPDFEQICRLPEPPKPPATPVGLRLAEPR